jgi:UDPglucose 6-dehydrogenase
MHHQGPVTAACLAELGVRTVAVDDDRDVIRGLAAGRAPLFEPGLEALLLAGLASGRLSFTEELASALAESDLLWVAFDTPVDEDDRADIEYVKARVRACYPHLRDGALVFITSQLPIGSTRELADDFAARAGGRRVYFATAPENLRLGKALETFRHADRIVVGVREREARAALEPLLARLTSNLLWVSVESAEMAKHATNAFLATSVALVNEIAGLCERSGADAVEVEAALRAEPRIGKAAYVKPGAAFAGGTLARDIVYLRQLALRAHCDVPLLASVLPSNQQHRLWALRQLELRLERLAGRRIGLLGLSYKPGTDSLRRSVAVELCRALVARGALVRAFDPKVKALPADLDAVSLAASPVDAARGAAALVVATEWPDFRNVDPREIASALEGRLVLDQSRFLERVFATEPLLAYVTVGKPL